MTEQGVRPGGVAIVASDVAIAAREIVGGGARDPARVIDRGVAIEARDVAIVARSIARNGARGPARGVAKAARGGAS